MIFIRPEGYKGLLKSKKAYAPATVRHINTFHICMEFVSLLLFIPEIFCFLFGSCGGRLSNPFLEDAFLRAIRGPERVQVFVGRFILALLPLRIFGMVRHWKQMWMTNTIIDPGWSKHHKGMLSDLLMPSSSSVKKKAIARNISTAQSLMENRKSINMSKQILSEEDIRKAAEYEQKRNDEYLVNATNIGTALMVINSHRALIMS